MEEVSPGIRGRGNVQGIQVINDIDYDSLGNNFRLHKEHGLNALQIAGRRLRGLDTALDISLLCLSIFLMVVLISVVSWYFCQKRKKSRSRLHDNIKGTSGGKYPEITVVRSKATGSDDSSNTSENTDTFSDVSSIWDSASQRYDKSYMEHKEMQEKRMENTIQILNSNSVDIHQTPSWLEIENNQNDGIGTPSAPGTDNNIYPKDSAEI